jgi:CBS-domain-containing membrane protein
MKASEIMTTPVVTVRPSTPIDDAAGLLTEHDINTLPVVDDDGRLVAVVTETDVFRAIALRHGIGLSPTAKLEAARYPREVRDIAHKPKAWVRAADEMTYCLTVMARQNGKALPVLDAGRVVGIISRREALQALAHFDVAMLEDLVRQGRLPADPQMAGSR